MKRAFAAALIGLAGLAGPTTVHAQIRLGGPIPPPVQAQAVYAAPGYYGTSYGYASYGLRQTYSTFASPYGPGYAYGYAPASYLPGPYGVGLWAPRTVTPTTAYRTPYYGTYAVPGAPAGVAPPPIGVYAPAFGPGLPPRVYWR